MPDRGFIVFSDDWGEHPSSSQHLFRRIAATHDVLWVNTIGMRKPRLSSLDLTKARRKIRKMLDWKPDRAKKRDDPPRLSVCQPFMLPYANNPLVRRINAVSVKRAVAKRARQMGMSAPILVSSVPNACDLVGKLGESCTVYYCVDDFSQWTGFDHDLVREMDASLIAKADVVLATSDFLHDHLQQSGKPVSMLTHGVDIEHFAFIPEREHPVLASISGPRIGFFGVIDDRLDQELVAAIARARPGVAFVFAGPVLSPPQLLRDLPNVHFLGSLAYAHLPFFVAGLSALILPYKVNDSTAAISPLKLKEYLATGRPVIATPMHEVLGFADYIHCHADATGWLDSIDAALHKPLGQGRRPVPDWLRQEGWDHKARQMLSLMTQA
jgi:glycosyltransferase involved in cell wall biosynthesis